MEETEEVPDALRQSLDKLLAKHGVDAHIERSVLGPSVARYEVTLGDATRVEDVTRLTETIKYTVGSKLVRVVSPVPGRSAIGIEVPRADRQTVQLDLSALDGAHALTLPIGVTTDWTLTTADLRELPHLLVGGATGGGKSTWVNVLLTTLIERNSPDVVRLALMDPKVVELAVYADIPHLWGDIVTDVKAGVDLGENLCAEMERRYAAMAETGVKNIDAYNVRADEPWPYIVVICDELADFMMADKGVKGKPFEAALVRLAQKARAAGLYLILATQRPSVDVVTGLLKTNIPARLAFRCATMPDSKVILDTTGAQHLLPHGDGLWMAPGTDGLERVQSPYMTADGIAAVVSSVIERYAPQQPDEQAPEPAWPTEDDTRPVVQVRPRRAVRVDRPATTGVTPDPIELLSQPVKDPFTVSEGWVPYLP